MIYSFREYATCFSMFAFEWYANGIGIFMLYAKNCKLLTPKNERGGYAE